MIRTTTDPILAIILLSILVLGMWLSSASQRDSLITNYCESINMTYIIFDDVDYCKDGDELNVIEWTR